MAGFEVTFSFFYVILAGSCVSGAIKMWSHDTNYANPSNWNLQRLPCVNDRVLFPVDVSVVVAMPRGPTKVREMVFSHTGEVLLAETGELTITGNFDSRAACLGEEIDFIAGEPRHWLDSANWNAPGVDLSDSPVPHRERIPCETDQAVLPEAGTFQVQLPDFPVKVGVLELNGKEISVEQLHVMTLDDTGYHAFKGDASQLQITGELCQDPRGCICNTELHPLTWKKICSFEAPRCPQARCESPITPSGFCCPICGASLDVAFTGSWAGMTQTIQSMILYNEKIDNYPVKFHISRIAKDKLQIVLRDSGAYVGQSVGLAMDLKKQFDTVTFGSTLFAKLMVSGDPVTSWGSASRIVTTTLLMVAIILAVIVLVNFVAAKYGQGGISVEHIQPSFLFARFENADAEVEIAQQAFQNPMYSITGASSSTVGKMSMKELEETQDDSSETESSAVSEKMFTFEE